jgi:hypothetical protein
MDISTLRDDLHRLVDELIDKHLGVASADRPAELGVARL